MEVLNYLNANPPVIVALVGLAGVVVQYLVKRVFKLSDAKLTNYVLALGAVPGLLTGVVALGTSLHMSQYPWVVVASQAMYAGYEKLKANAEKQAEAKLAALNAPDETLLAQPAEVVEAPPAVADNSDLPIAG